MGPNGLLGYRDHKEAMMSTRQTKKGNTIIEGKSKIVFENQENPNTVIIQFKDDISADTPTKHRVLPGRAEIDSITNASIFQFLEKKKIRTHFIKQINRNSFLAKKLSYRFPVKVITRRLAYGSILKRQNLKAGDQLRIPLTEFFYKDRKLHDPKLDDVQEGPQDYFLRMRMLSGRVFGLLEKAFRAQKHQLVDLKLEYGIAAQDNELVVIDEISAGALRLWPFKKENPDFSLHNLLISGELEPEGKVDKDLYREGKPLEVVREGLEKLAKLAQKL
jgi:phosphoribosylaminoimidazole-succinocarboxamide synthase